MVDILPDIKLFNFDELTDWVKGLIRDYGDEILAVVFVLIFVIAGVKKMGYV